jgi:hypothetical protein
MMGEGEGDELVVIPDCRSEMFEELSEKIRFVG